MKNSIKFLAFSFFAFCLSFNISAQDTRAERKVDGVKTEKKQVDKTEKIIKRANKLADKVEMDDGQRERFVTAEVDFTKAVKATRKSATSKEDRKAQVKELRIQHKENLSSFLSASQMESLAQIAKERKEKRKMGKGKKGKKGKKIREGQSELAPAPVEN